MNPRWLRLAADMLETAADQFANHGCADWEFPCEWSEADKIDFCRAYERYNSRGAIPSYPDNNPPADHAAMGFLAFELREHALMMGSVRVPNRPKKPSQWKGRGKGRK